MPTSAPLPPQLPDLALGELLGEGGMGAVWAADHRRWGRPVAVKLLTGDHTPARLALFHREVRILAALRHEHIVPIWDHGQVDGMPYLVMERAAGSLAGQVLAWPTLRHRLLELLSALSHAHARQVLHLDVKPSNLLVTPNGRLQLSDFGIARGASDTTDGRVRGSLATMAPEQLKGAERRFGPATDLFAVGCVAYLCAVGRAPFDTRSRTAAIGSRRSGPPPLPPVGPPGFAAWVLRMLQPDPRQRFRAAVDAAEALAELAQGDAAEALPSPLALPTSTSTAGSHTATAGATFEHETSSWAPEAPEEPEPPPAPADRRRATLPSDWRRPTGAMAPPPKGFGRALVRLRSPATVGRQHERDGLWAALREVDRRRRPQVVLLRGAEGVGKKHLARWLAESAAELGGCPVVTVPPAGPHPIGLRNALRRTLRADGLVGRPLTAHLRRQHLPEVGTVARLLEGTHDLPENERTRWFVRLLGQVAGDRPLVLVVPDLHHHPDSIHLAAFLATQDDVPVLVLGTLPDDAGATREALERLEATPHTRTLPIGPLSEVDHRALVRGVLHLHGDLAAQLEQHTAGSPAYAVQLLGDWVDRGVLVEGPHGFELALGVPLVLPPDLHHAWLARIRGVATAAGELEALERAAVLGVVVDPEQWRQVAPLATCDALEPRLFDRGLITPHGDHWVFGHRLFRDALLRSAHDTGRWAGHHEACAAALRSSLAGNPGPADAERLGRHLLEAGAPEQAVDHLLLGLQEHDRLGDVTGALALGLRIEEALRGRATGPRHARLELYRSKAYRLQGRYDEALTHARRAEELSIDAEAHLLVGEARNNRAALLQRRGQLQEAGALFRAATESFERGGEPWRTAAPRLGLAEVLVHQGDLHGAEDALLQALDQVADQPPQLIHAKLELRRGTVLLYLGRCDEARPPMERARQAFAERGHRFLEASALNDLGNLHRRCGRTHDAVRALEDAERLFTEAGVFDAVVPRMNRCMVLLDAERYREASEAVAVVAQRAAELKRRTLEAAAQAVWLWGLAGAAQWEDFARHHPICTTLLDDTGLVQREVAQALAAAAALADDGPHPLLAADLHTRAAAMEAALR